VEELGRDSSLGDCVDFKEIASVDVALGGSSEGIADELEGLLA